VTCVCCGQEREEAQLAPLQCHETMQVCRHCIGWLRARAGVPDSTPILPVRDIAESRAFFESAGFAVRSYEGGGFAFVEYHGHSVFDLDEAEGFDPAANRAGCYLIVPGVEEWHARLVDEGLPVTGLADQPWGMREFTLTDPNGNIVRIGRAVAD
jgi:catechol 2,3-dioxygenase-like lactoylglutathione lyase family enzyme